MELTEKFLRIDNHACEEGYQWWLDNDQPSDLLPTLYKLTEDNHNDWANWVIVRFMTHEQKVQYAIFAAEQVIDIYEKKYPTDGRPRKAIEAAKNYLKDKSLTNKEAAYAAAHAAAHAYDAAAYTTAYAAAHATAYAAAHAAAHAYDAAAYAAYAAHAAAHAAAYAAAHAAKKEMQVKILEYGIGLLTA
jgi:hypothetical protein